MIELITIISVVLIDQASKILAINELTKIDTFPIINGVFHLTYATNTGAAFSIFSNKTFYLGIVSLISVILLSVFLYSEKKKGASKYMTFSLSLIIGGAIGNGIDRFIRGYVVDFFDFRLINFAVFNVADSFVVVGVILLAISILFEKKLSK